MFQQKQKDNQPVTGATLLTRFQNNVADGILKLKILKKADAGLLF